jgi:hypothetical protein
MTLIDGLSLLLAVGGLAAPMLTRICAHDARAGLPMMLELWTAGGLLRLAGTPSWSAILSAAAVFALRELVVRELGSRRGRALSRAP